jgi:hypothetical protein
VDVDDLAVANHDHRRPGMAASAIWRSNQASSSAVEAGPVGRLPPDDGISAWSCDEEKDSDDRDGFCQSSDRGGGGGVRSGHFSH